MSLKPKPRPSPRAPAAPVAAPAGPSIPAFLERHSRVLAIALVLLATARIVSTYPVFNHTFDENAHLACGMEWLAEGAYRWEAQHPPLARVAAALGPYLLGVRPQGTPRDIEYAMSLEGDAILYAGHHYERTLAAARLGILPFFWIACLTVYHWGKRYFSPATAVASLFLFTFVPPILAHSGLATTDMALTAFLGAAFLRGFIWVESPTVRNAVWFGVISALAFLSKFSYLVYFPAVSGLMLLWYLASVRPDWRRLARAAQHRLPTLALAVAISLPIIWAGYRFSFGAPPGASFRMPAPEIYGGIQEVAEHNRGGHPSYLFGTISRTGSLLLYPVALAVKTPIGILLLAAIGLWAAWRVREKLPYAPYAIAFSAGILIPALASSIKIGTRHILPVYFGITLLGGAGLVWLLEKGISQRKYAAAAGVLAAWLAVSSLISHPDYIPYFNEFAGSHPEEILADSDLDWGQDINRLGKRLRELGAKSVTFQSLLKADLEKEHGFPHLEKEMDVVNPTPGWSAVSMTVWKAYRFGLLDRYPDTKLWPDRYTPTEKVGKTILLYYFPPAPQ